MAGEPTQQRRLAAILAADVVGYSRLMEADEVGTLAALKERRKGILQPLVAEHHGRIIKVMGDGVLVEFASAVSAVACAVELQKRMAAANDGVLEQQRIMLRVGINLGDVIVEGGDLYGDGVNIAARLENLAEPGGILVSNTAYDYVRNKVGVGFDDLGAQTLKNLAEPVRVYSVIADGKATPKAKADRSRTNIAWKLPAAGAALAILVAAAVGAWLFWPRTPEGPPLPEGPSIAVLPFANLSDDPRQEYFADGIADNLITDLSQVPGLFVTSRQSTLIYKGQPVDPKKIGRELGVATILEGSVQKAGEQIRINAQLINAATGGHEWADRYDGSMEDIFGLQDRVTKAVVEALSLQEKSGAQVAADGRHETEIPAAYDAFLLGWESYKRSTPANLVAAIPISNGLSS
jgi:TolB-like protein/class 3 adenylate cyclase